MKIWMAEKNKSKSHYGVKQLGFFIPTFSASLLFLAYITFRSSYKWDEISAAVFAAAFATALLLFISRTRYLAQRELYVFCRDNDWRLFVVNLQSQTKERSTLLGNILTDFEIGALLDKYRNQPILEKAMEKPHSLVPYVPQILKVKYIIE